jgi:DNA-3-methyladenine glycosylase II
MSQSNPVFSKAQRLLSRRDPVLKDLIRQVGPCTLRLGEDPFGILVRAIVAQQISTKAARSISDRLAQILGTAGVCPAAILAAEEEALRQAGLSTAKRKSLRDLAEKVHCGAVNLTRLPDLPDEEVIAHLVPVRGIGPWTAEMFLIFGLGRLDILPVADFGLRAGVKRFYQLDDLPKKDQLLQIGEPWRPYRSIATWFFWRSFGAVPQSD